MAPSASRRSAPPSKRALAKEPSVVPSPTPVTPVEPAAPAPVATISATAQKRVLPSRNRRGAPGHGTNEIDQMILDVKRRADEVPIIPPTTLFLLTTDSSLVPQLDESSLSADLASYFARPEVIQGLKAREEIETPDYVALQEGDAVSGRLRVRGGDELAADTSDEAYLRRHRKYETFEKRQRRREKEKLMHEQYKLRERIDQLRGMDGSSFIPPGGSVADGEARRRQLLLTAELLEARYNLLLPPENRKGPPKKGATDPDVMQAEDAVSRPGRGKRKEPPIARQDSDIEQSGKASPSVLATGSRINGREGKGKLYLRLKLSGRPVNSLPISQSVPDLSSMGKGALSRRAGSAAPAARSMSDTPGSTARAKRAKTVAPSASMPSLTRRGSVHPSSSIGDTTNPREPVSILLLTALRHGTIPPTRKHMRQTLPFGIKLPPRVEEELEFELPDWLRRPHKRRRVARNDGQEADDEDDNSMDGVESDDDQLVEQEVLGGQHFVTQTHTVHFEVEEDGK